MAVQKGETFEPVTMGHIRSHGCRDLLVYCGSGRCHHSATLNADWLSDATQVRSLPTNGVHALWNDQCRCAPRLGAAC
jgi:hypothetical protein